MSVIVSQLCFLVGTTKYLENITFASEMSKNLFLVFFEVFDLSFGVDNIGDIIDEKGLSNFQDKVNIILFSIFSFSP